MNTFVKTLGLIVALTVLLAPSSNGAFPQGKNIKTSAKELNSLQRFLIRKFKPEVPLDKILAEELAAEGGNTNQDGYYGGIEWWNIELPLFLLQLNKIGDEIIFPSWSYDEGFWYCYMGICFGWNRIWSLRKPVVKGVQSATLDGSMNGTQLRLHYQIPDVVASDPLYTYDDTDYGSDPPATQTNNLYENATIFIKNFSILMTADFQMGLTGIEADNLNIEWSMDDFRIRYENGTYTASDGSQEAFGPKERLVHEELMQWWHEEIEEGRETMKEYIQNTIKKWLNCFLSNGRNGGVEEDCRIFFLEPLHAQSFAELIHSFGLSALNKARNAEK